MVFESDFWLEPEESSGQAILEPVAGQNSGAPEVGNWYEFPLGPRTPNKMLKPTQEPVRHPPGLGWDAVGARAPSARAPAQPCAIRGQTEGRLGGGARPMSGRVGLASAGERKRSSRACALVVCKRGTCGHLQC